MYVSPWWFKNHETSLRENAAHAGSASWGMHRCLQTRSRLKTCFFWPPPNPKLQSHCLEKIVASPDSRSHFKQHRRQCEEKEQVVVASKSLSADQVSLPQCTLLHLVITHRWQQDLLNEHWLLVWFHREAAKTFLYPFYFQLSKRQMHVTNIKQPITTFTAQMDTLPNPPSIRP